MSKRSRLSKNGGKPRKSRTKKIYDVVKTVPDELWDKQFQMASWRRKHAEQVYKKLKPLEGKLVLLSGGGAMMGDVSSAKLKKLVLKKPTYYRRDSGAEYIPKRDVWVIEAQLSNYPLEGSSGFPLGKETFSPHLGSWKISELKERVK